MYELKPQKQHLVKMHYDDHLMQLNQKSVNVEKHKNIFSISRFMERKECFLSFPNKI